MSANAKRWESVKELLHQAMQLEPERRSQFLDQACSSNPSLRAELESLLGAEESVRTNFMESPPLADEVMGVQWPSAAPRGLEPGQIFCQRFQLVRKLGEGGMGQVWLAEQTSPVRRQVALKLIKAGMYDEAVVQRFQAERQSLAIMDHPAIAKVFDAGATEQGQPYFVMEYVPGLPITEYCDQKKLTIKRRLELFMQACEGVQHAHQKAIIHRDLKPANILVVEVDGKPVPRIIDFGLAKATTPQLDDEAHFTQLGSFVGTPAFMSPEQANAGQDIDTRTDVYSLGVIFYLLLTGTLPLDVKQWRALPLVEILHKLREEEPAPPSVRLTAARQGSAGIAEVRGTDPKQLIKLLHGDLDWIAMKALEKDRARRYGTPSELAADIQRYLNHEPIKARPASASYRLQKYVRRHRVGVAMATLLVILFAGFAGLQAVQLRRTTRERDRASRITDFMTNMFKVSDPSEARGNSVTAREILDKAANDMGTGLARDPEVQSDMAGVMASTYENLGLYARAHDLAQRALDTRMRQLGPKDPKTLESMAQLGWILARQGHDADAEKLERQALAGEQRLFGPESVPVLETTDRLAVVLKHEGRLNESEKLERDCIEIGTRKFGPDNTQTMQALNHLGGLLLVEDRNPEAEQVYRQLLDAEGRVLRPDHPETLKAQDNLAIAVFHQGRLAEAEQLYRGAVAAHERVLGLEHQNTLRTMGNLAIVLQMEGNRAESEKLFRDVLAGDLRTLGPEHPDTLTARTNLASMLLGEGQAHEAEIMDRETLAAQLSVLGPANPATLLSQGNLANDLLKEGQYAQAEKVAREAFDTEKRTLGLQHPETLDALKRLGIAMAFQQRYAEARKMFHDLMETDSASKGGHFSLWYAFACVAVAANRPDDALQDLREAIQRGYKDANALAIDDDFKSLRRNPGFEELVASLRASAISAH